VIAEEDAKAIILDMLNSREHQDTFVIQSCALSPRGDYWIIRANSEDYVLRGMGEKCYVGVNAHLVSTLTGDTELVGSAASVESYLQDKYDLAAAGDQHYVLAPAFAREEKAALVNLRQKLSCSYPEALRLMEAPQKAWITGRLSTLKTAQELLQQNGISVMIELRPVRAPYPYFCIQELSMSVDVITLVDWAHFRAA
jgi:hypothetical protein